MAQTPLFTTRFNKDDTLRLKKHIEVSGLTATDFIRRAVLEHLERLERGQEERLYNQVAESIGLITKSNQEAYKASTDRTCSLLARVGIEVHALVEYFSMLEGGQEIMDACMAKSRKRISKALEPADAEVKDLMQKRVVNGG